MKSTVVGPYPRVGSELGKALRDAINRSYSLTGTDYTESVERINEMRAQLAREVVAEMVAAGISLPNYGLVAVHDEISWPLEYATGVQVEGTGMKKIFHTNTHYRELVVNGRIEASRDLATRIRTYDAARGAAPEIKLEFPGPYTLAKHSVITNDAPYSDVRELAFAYADFYRQQLEEMNRNLARVVQFNEPSVIAFDRDHSDIDMLPEVYERMMKGISAQSIVWTFYGTYDPHALEVLFALPVDVIGLDFVWDPELPYKMGNPQQAIGIGLIDSGDRGSLIHEDYSAVLRRLRTIGEYIDLSRAYLSANATLEHLPRQDARNKLELVGALKKEINGEQR